MVESGVKYVKGNMWPGMRCTDDADPNRQALEWCESIANRRILGTTSKVPWEMLEERPHLGGRPNRGVGAISPRGAQGGPGRLRQLGGLPLRGALVVGGPCRTGGPAPGHRESLGRQ